MNIACPECSTIYRVDPARVPHGGISGRCRSCGATLRVEPGPTAPGSIRTASLAPAAQQGGAPAAVAVPEEEAPAPQEGAGVQEEVSAPAIPAERAEGGARPRPETPVFGPQDPDTRAKRLARALVSDIVVYNPDRWEQSRTAGTLRKDFRDEILKSWEEYTEQVGEEMAKKTPYFRDALNAILAEGKKVF